MQMLALAGKLDQEPKPSFRGRVAASSRRVMSSCLERLGLVMFTCLFLVVPAPAPGAAGTTETLELSFALETRLFESAFKRYQAAREDEKAALSVLVEVGERADRAAAAQNLDDETSWAIEDELMSARSEYLTASTRAGDHRRAIYRHLERLTELGTVISQIRNRSLVKTEQLDGRWRIDVTPSDELGLIDLRLDGTLVTGTYRLSSGAQGSIRGTYVNHRLTLERVDTQRGYDMTLTGVHDVETGEISGVWNAIGPADISGGDANESFVTGDIRHRWDALDGSGPGDTQGEWTARKLSPAQEPRILPE